ncbi:hypothetical protein [Azospirillum sp. TSO35-2]|uniref:hypothetical protein n=1 Tax=Azospirillum sp. TSO35-2 TaxID=716796 RepID=UPI0018EEC57E|nr:hypothetical protein [Azospirillum sp. TSO35-2]
MTEAKLGLIMTAVAVVGVAVALHRQRALSRGGLMAVIGATAAVFAAMFFTQ